MLAWGHLSGFGHAYGLILTRNITTLFSCYQFWVCEDPKRRRYAGIPKKETEKAKYNKQPSLFVSGLVLVVVGFVRILGLVKLDTIVNVAQNGAYAVFVCHVQL